MPAHGLVFGRRSGMGEPLWPVDRPHPLRGLLPEAGAVPISSPSQPSPRTSPPTLHSAKGSQMKRHMTNEPRAPNRLARPRRLAREAGRWLGQGLLGRVLGRGAAEGEGEVGVAAGDLEVAQVDGAGPVACQKCLPFFRYSGDRLEMCLRWARPGARLSDSRAWPASWPAWLQRGRVGTPWTPVNHGRTPK